MVRSTVKLSELADETPVFQEEERVMTARELRQLILDGSEDRKTGWLVGIPETWKPNAESAFEGYIENEYDTLGLYENADTEMRFQINPLLPQIQVLLNEVKLAYYSAGDSIEVDDISHSSCTYCGTIEELTVGSDNTCICPDCLTECEPVEDGGQ